MAEHGVDVHFGIIAKAAGVGRATLYRHFPDREALLEALLKRSLDILEEVASQHQGNDAVFQVLEYHASHVDRHAAMSTYWRVSEAESPGLAAARERFAALMQPLLDRAIAGGLCDPDITLLDIRSIFLMLTALPTRPVGGVTLSDPQRMLSWIVNGLQSR